MGLLWLLMFACLLQITSSTSPLSVACDYSEYEAKITYTGDAFAVLATKNNGERFWFEEDVSTASFQLIVLYEPEEESEDEQCVFDHGGFSIYTLTVQSRKTFKNFESLGDEDFTVECNFETFVSDIIGSISIDSPIIVPTLVSQVLGTPSGANFTIKLVRMDGTDLADGPVVLGRLVKLKIEMTPNTTEEVGFRATSCYATTDDRTKNKVILAEGCGTGSPFEQVEGFTTNEFVGFSPVFRLFRMEKDQGTIFSCNFVICSTNCSGNSCPAAATGRKRRDVSEIIITNNERENNQLISDNSISTKLARAKRDLFEKYKNAIGPNITKVVTSTSKLLYMSGLGGLDTLSRKIPFHIGNQSDNQDSSVQILKGSNVQKVSTSLYSDDEPSSSRRGTKTVGFVRRIGKNGNGGNAEVENTNIAEKETLTSRLVVHVNGQGGSLTEERGSSVEDSTVTSDSNGVHVDTHLADDDSINKNSKSSEKNSNSVVNGNLNSVPMTDFENDHMSNDDLTMDNNDPHNRDDIFVKEKGREQQFKEKQQGINTTKKSVNLESKDKKFKSHMMERLKAMQTKIMAFSSVSILGLAGLVAMALIIVCVLRRRRERKIN